MLVLLLLVGAYPVPIGINGSTEAYKIPPIGNVSQQMLSYGNKIRNKKGKKPLAIHPILAKAAQDHADRMAKHTNMSHLLGGNHIIRARNAGWYSKVSENIAVGYKNIAHCFSGWYNSKGHYKNLVGDWKYVGYGYAVNNSGVPYWAALYGNK